jgi:RimJ/RimL family protein N-acetyltransferase
MYQGKLVRLRAFERADVEMHWAFMNDYDTVRSMSSGMLYPTSREDEARYLEQQTGYTRGEYQFAMETLSGQLIGRCGFTRVDWKNRLAEIGIMIGEAEFRGKGYGSDALRLLIRIAFEELNLHKLKLSVFAFNLQALGCYEKCGFIREGLLKDELFREGRYHDVVVLGLCQGG